MPGVEGLFPHYLSLSLSLVMFHGTIPEVRILGINQPRYQDLLPFGRKAPGNEVESRHQSCSVFGMNGFAFCPFCSQLQKKASYNSAEYLLTGTGISMYSLICTPE